MSKPIRDPLSQRWKAWVLLSGAGITIAGALALRSSEGRTLDRREGNAAVETQPAMPVATIARRQPSVPRAGDAVPDRALRPVKPARPLFAAPVTRTRRS